MDRRRRRNRNISIDGIQEFRSLSNPHNPAVESKILSAGRASSLSAAPAAA
jgi:hypothetical protein